MRYLMGIDNGGTFSKAALFDENGVQISVASVPTVTLTPKPGYTERDMEEMWEANCQVIRRALEKAGVTGKDIVCVAVCGHGKGLYLWGKDCGRVLFRAWKRSVSGRKRRKTRL